MCLSCKDNLYRSIAVVNDLFKSLQIMQYQVGTLVACHSTCKTDGQNIGVKHNPFRHSYQRINTLIRPFLPYSFAHKVDKTHFIGIVHIPDLLCFDLFHPAPHRFFIFKVLPLLTQHLVIGSGQFIAQPGRNVHTVRHVFYGYILFVIHRKDIFPYFFGHFRVFLADSIALMAHFQPQHGHVETGIRRIRIDTETEELVLAQPESLPVVSEIIAHHIETVHIRGRLKRCMRCKNRSFFDFFYRLFQTHFFIFNETSDPFKKRKSRMSFIQMENGVLDAELFEHPVSAYAEHDLLSETLVHIGDIKMGAYASVPRVILFHIRIEQIEGHTPDIDLPDRSVDRRVDKRHLYGKMVPVLVKHPFNRCIVFVYGFIRAVLPAVAAYDLPDIALCVHKADPYERKPHIA